MINIKTYERELKKRWKYPYAWGRVQNDRFDTKTSFVYHIFPFEQVVKEIQRRFVGDETYTDTFNYALNRWYNFWSARAIETIFCSMTPVSPAANRRDALVDFNLKGIDFDHKTSVYPQRFGRELSYAVNHPSTLITWLYQHQSQQRRRHYANRLFLVLYNFRQPHWRLKAELTWLEKIVRDYVNDFDSKRIYHLLLKPGVEILSDIIWAIHG